MPYYVYRVIDLGAIRRLEWIGEYAAYPEASARVKALRAAADPEVGRSRMIFADNRLAAEELLSQSPAPEPLIGDDY
ncbi:MAG TPA: hypothetical protein VMU33_07575 [Burkholderiaceae bacterium]|nr:hypothetical protein [Burkholderiaceae bacterium]